MSSAADRPASTGAHRARVAAWRGLCGPLSVPQPESQSVLQSMPLLTHAVIAPLRGADVRSALRRLMAAPVSLPSSSSLLPS